MKKVLTLFLLCFLLFSLCGCKGSDYKKAMSAAESGKYEEAISMFDALGDYKESKFNADKFRVKFAKELIDKEKFADAIDVFSQVKTSSLLNSWDVSDAFERIIETCLKSGDFNLAKEYLGKFFTFFNDNEFDMEYPVHSVVSVIEEAINKNEIDVAKQIVSEYSAQCSGYNSFSSAVESLDKNVFLSNISGKWDAVNPVDTIAEVRRLIKKNFSRSDAAEVISFLPEEISVYKNFTITADGGLTNGYITTGDELYAVVHDAVNSFCRKKLEAINVDVDRSMEDMQVGTPYELFLLDANESAVRIVTNAVSEINRGCIDLMASQGNQFIIKNGEGFSSCNNKVCVSEDVNEAKYKYVNTTFKYSLNEKDNTITVSLIEGETEDQYPQIFKRSGSVTPAEVEKAQAINEAETNAVVKEPAIEKANPSAILDCTNDIFFIDDSILGMSFDEANALFGGNFPEMQKWEWGTYDKFFDYKVDGNQYTFFFKNNVLKGLRYEIVASGKDMTQVDVYKGKFGNPTTRSDGDGYHFNLSKGYLEVFLNVYDGVDHIAMHYGID